MAIGHAPPLQFATELACSPLKSYAWIPWRTCHAELPCGQLAGTNRHLGERRPRAKRHPFTDEAEPAERELPFPRLLLEEEAPAPELPQLPPAFIDRTAIRASSRAPGVSPCSPRNRRALQGAADPFARAEPRVAVRAVSVGVSVRVEVSTGYGVPPHRSSDLRCLRAWECTGAQHRAPVWRP